MNPNISIYRRLNPTLLVQVEVSLGLLHWANISNISLTSFLKLKAEALMNAWGWISMRRSLEDALKNAFEETMMKNVPNDQFWCFKWRNKVQNRNLCEKLSKIGRFGNFNFWSKVNTTVKVNKGQSQLVKTVKGQLLLNVLHGPSWFRVKSRIKLQSRWFHHDNVD